MQAKLIALAGIGLVILSLIAGLFYYKAKAANAQATINTLGAKVSVLKSQATTLEVHIATVQKRMNSYIQAIGKIADKNTVLNKKLQVSRNKLARHKLLKDRNSAHSEMVLRIINNSIARDQRAWMK